MSATISSILAELRADHVNIARLLDLVEAQLLKVDGGETPDLELLHDIMQYMIIYSDAIHHPREDLVYRALREAGKDPAGDLERVEADHMAMAERGLTLRNDIEAMIAGAEITRERVMRDSIDYVHGLRRHMEWEEQDLFRRADELVADEDRALELGTLDSVDPVFGDVTHAVFDNLRHHLELAASA